MARRLRRVLEELDRAWRMAHDPAAALPAHEGSRFQRTLRPRIGQLRQYSPAPVVLPVHYGWARAPRRTPTISLVTPSFNQVTFIERTLTSVLSQRYPSLEYVIQDGGSTDGTLEVLDRYRGQPLLVRSAPDGGQADAINLGFADTRGEIMGWLNSDDLLMRGALAAVGRAFARHPEVDVVFGDRVLVDEHDQRIGWWLLPSSTPVTLPHHDLLAQEAVFWRRRIWERAGGLRAELQSVMDWDLFQRFHEAGARFHHLPRVIGGFRVHSAQKTQTLQALHDQEADQIWLRLHGQRWTPEQALRSMWPTMMRHVPRHLAWRAWERSPLPRIRPLDVGTSRQRLRRSSSQPSERHGRRAHRRPAQSVSPSPSLY